MSGTAPGRTGYEVRRAPGPGAARGGIRWPRAELCLARRAKDSDLPECICRAYDEAEGYYVIEDLGPNRAGHARAYFHSRAVAVVKARTLSVESNEDPVVPVPAAASPGTDQVAALRTDAERLDPPTRTGPRPAEDPSLFPPLVTL